MTAIPLVHPWGNRLAQLGVPRRARAGRPARRSRSPTTATACRSTATCAARRSRSSGSNRVGCTRGSTTAPTPTSSRRSRSPTRSTSTRASTRVGSGCTTIVEPTDPDRGADLVLLAPVPAAARAVARTRLDAALARVRARRGRRAHRCRPARARRSRPKRAPIGKRTFDDHYALGTGPTLLGRRPAGARCGSRSTRTTRSAAVRPAASRVHRDRADDRDHRRARPRRDADVRARHHVRRVVHDLVLGVTSPREQ